MKISKIQIRPEDLDEYLNKNGLTKENIKDNYDKENNILQTTSEEIKILQLSDIQIDNLTEAITPFNIAKEVIAKTKPDLIVLTGDNLGNSGGKKEITKLAKFMDSFEIPWAPVYGNHDYWASVSIKKQNKVFEFKRNDKIEYQYYRQKIVQKADT